VQASPTNIEVNETGWWWGGESGTFNASSTPIQHAIDNASEGDTIFVHKGTYNKSITIDKPLTL
jgi:pectin methylesterase-like acyl-CoA thioesterase